VAFFLIGQHQLSEPLHGPASATKRARAADRSTRRARVTAGHQRRGVAEVDDAAFAGDRARRGDYCAPHAR